MQQNTEQTEKKIIDAAQLIKTPLRYDERMMIITDQTVKAVLEINNFGQFHGAPDKQTAVINYIIESVNHRQEIEQTAAAEIIKAQEYKRAVEAETEEKLDSIRSHYKAELSDLQGVIKIERDLYIKLQRRHIELQEKYLALLSGGESDASTAVEPEAKNGNAGGGDREIDREIFEHLAFMLSSQGKATFAAARAFAKSNLLEDLLQEN
jgi:hypothetical protein